MLIQCIITMGIVLCAEVQAFAAGPIEVFAGIPPVAYLVERIGGDRVHVEVLIQPGQDPHTFEAAPKQIQALGKAKLFFKVGMPFENQLLEKIRGVHPGMMVVDTAEGIKKRLLAADSPVAGGDHADQHSHGHAPEEQDPHVWLSPPMVKIMAINIALALEKIDPGHSAFFKANLLQLHRDLDAADEKIRQALNPYAGRTFYVFHPAFGYFGDCYYLKQEAIEAEGKQPSPKQLRELIEKAKSENVKIIFIQPQFDRHSAQAVADAIGGRVLPINDMEKDIPANLQDMSGKIKKAFEEVKTQH
jgi:zinc transport system substrate-binding protein